MSTTHLPPPPADWATLVDAEPCDPCGACGQPVTWSTLFSHECPALASSFIPGDASQFRPSDDVDYRPWGDGEPGTGSGSARVSNRLTDKQAGLIARLMVEIDPEVTDADAAATSGRLSKRQASDLIDGLMALRDELRRLAAGRRPAAVEAPAPAVPAGCRPNRYAGPCRHCGQQIAAEAGLLCKDQASGRWTVEHNGTCPAAAPVEPLTTVALAHAVPAGHYAIPSTGDNDLVFYRVDRPEEGEYAGRVFVKMIVGGHPERNVRRGVVASILARIEEAGPDAAAVLYGQEIGRCWKCNRHLTDEASRAAGIGPDCATRV